MAFAGKLLNPFRQAFTVVNTSSKSLRLRRLHGEFEPLKTWRKILEPYLHSNFSRFSDGLNIQRKYIQNFSLSGSKSVGGIFGVSVIFASVCYQPHVAIAMDGHDVLLDDYQIDLLGASDSENDSLAFWTFIKKFWLPAFFLLTVLVNWDHPINLVTKIVLLLLGTKPSPLSVYIYVEQLCHQSMRQKPHMYIFKTLYAKKVEVQDYKLLCLARVEVGDQKLALVGILGGWWEFPSPGRLFSAFRALLRNKVIYLQLE